MALPKERKKIVKPKVQYMADAPFAVQLELAEGCQLRCSFCGLNGIRTKKDHDFKFMTAATIRDVMRQIVGAQWNPRIEFAMHGEPTMHPDFVGMVREAREIAPRMHMMMTSNGGGLLRPPGAAGNVALLFDAGLNVLALDDYEGVKIVGKVRAVLDEIRDKVPNLEAFEYPENAAGSPHARRPPNSRTIVMIQDISTAKKGNHSLLNNHAGAGAPPLKEPLQARCAKPFREMSVRWDGNVAVCCNDWRGTYKCGNIVSDGLHDVWHSVEMDAARRELMKSNRNFGPCAGCDATSYRLGLLPDKFGRQKMPEPNSVSRAAIKSALAGAPYTAQVSREWEK